MNPKYIGMGDMESGGRGDVLKAVLGSCVGVVLFDRAEGVGCMAHIMLPHGRDEGRPGKYADRFLSPLLSRIRGRGGRLVEAFIVGGSNMFPDLQPFGKNHIGEANSLEVKRQLRQAGIPVRGEDLGGTKGRTVEFRLDEMRLRVKSLGNKKEVCLVA